eukprot:13322677-Alexandrium_andersonii.AAC.1
MKAAEVCPKHAQSLPTTQTAQNTPISRPSPIGTFGLAPLFFFDTEAPMSEHLRGRFPLWPEPGRG